MSTSIETKMPTGAVMVVGGGIAGMQASLDLADQGFRVYLVESKTAIGGHMAQLDKTFPTNDCSMCTISPKLVDVGRHQNINLHTGTEIVDLTGEPGSFTVQLRQKPRYIDLDKCVGCGDCADVCPVILPDQFDENLSTRKAAFKLYPQAVPNAYAIEKLGIAPCRDACPSGQRAQGYIALIREGRYQDALRVIKEDNPFPGICGRICNHRCEDACSRGKVDEAVNIRALKRFVTDKVYSEPRVTVDACETVYSERVAIVGAGPCGLTAAQDLALEGYKVTVLEALPVAGGMLRVGVPEYRLPVDIIEREVQDIVDLGVEIKLNHQVQDLDVLFDEGYQAVLIAVGAHEGIRLPIPGSNLDGVLVNTLFLRDVRLGTLDYERLGRVLVLGGGNVAIDCARTAVRLGAESVEMAFLESRNEMPSHEWEVQAAQDEGIKLHPSRTFDRILGNNQGHVTGVECQSVSSFAFDATGRLEVDIEEDSQHIVECDTLIFSVGQRAGLAFLPDDAGVGLTAKRTISINPNTMAATRPGVFAAGDSVSGTAFVIEAVDSGHKAAQSIHRYLRGMPLEPSPRPELPVVQLSEEDIEQRKRDGLIEIQSRVPLPELSVEERRKNFAEVEKGYDDESAQAEAARCLACGVCSECLSCQYECKADAVIHDMAPSTDSIDVGAIILAPGFEPFPAANVPEYGFGRYPNVVTSLQFERLLSASGPTHGHVLRPSDNQPARRIAFLQCIGSRDQEHDYCSSVCCMYATKQAIMAKEHDPKTEVDVFMMDMRSFSKGYDEYYHRAQEKYNVKYRRCRISEIKQQRSTHDLLLRYTDGTNQGGSSLVEQAYDMVVLSIGMQVSQSVKSTADQLGIELNQYGFARTHLYDPTLTSREGIFAVGAFKEPKDIPESVIEASGGAASAAALLAPSRGSLAAKIEFPPEKDVSEQEPRIGVFVCHCGSNIGGFLDVPSVAEYAATLPYVVHAEDNLYSCSQDAIEHITEQVKEQDLNRVVVASCTPITHEPLFRDSIKMAGLNPYLFEMANIRNHCSWVHGDAWDESTRKAKALVRMAVARAQHLEPQQTSEIEISQSALVIGGGPAGMTAAQSLAEQGFPVHLVEREPVLGGHLIDLNQAVDAGTWLNGPESSPRDFLDSLILQVSEHPLISLHLGWELDKLGGFVGKFSSCLVDTRDSSNTVEVEHGVVIVATGGQEYRGSDYGYGEHPAVSTQQEFERTLAESVVDDLPDSLVMMQCVGPADEYCSRICCSVALKNAIRFKQIKPDSQVTILYRDIRTYGFKENLYTQARSAGVLFARYDVDQKPDIDCSGDKILISLREVNLGRQLQLQPEMLVLSMPVIPSDGTEELVSKLRVSVDLDGWFMEAHVKLRPVDFASEGIFIAGTAHYPKLLDEVLVQARAASSRAANILAKGTMLVGGRIAVVDQDQCVGCLTCARICPFEVPVMAEAALGVGDIVGAAYIEPALCQGCGTCAAECPAKAIELKHFSDIQMQSKVDALFETIPIDIPVVAGAE